MSRTAGRRPGLGPPTGRAPDADRRGRDLVPEAPRVRDRRV